MKKMTLSIMAIAAVCSTSMAQDWLLNGNAGTNGGINYLGTTDLHPLVFRTDAQERMRIDSTNGFVGIGTTAPKYKLSVNGTATLAHRTIALNDTPVIYLSNQSQFLGSIAFGNGLRNQIFIPSNPNAICCNTAVGIDASVNAQYSWNTTAVGYKALQLVTSGANSTAVGAWALSKATNAENSAFGSGALRETTTGSVNTALGTATLYNNTSGAGNVAVGHQSMLNNISGYWNIAIGNQAMQTNVSGTWNTVLGTSANTLSNNLTNAAAFGSRALIGKSNAISLGDTTKPTLVGIGTAYPDYQLDVRAAANPARLRGLQAGSLSDYVVTATSDGVLRQIPASSIGGGTVNADQGLTTDGSNTVFLGDDCSKGGGKFKKDREINMDNLNLYFNSSDIGKLYMGIAGDCRKLDTRLEISAKGLPYINDYDVSRPSPSGLRFTDLTAKDTPVKPKYKGVLSLDDDGDVIWVEAPCCDAGSGSAAASEVEELKNTVKDMKAEIAELKSMLYELKGLGSETNWKVDGATNKLFQNVPNPSDKTTRIEYILNKDCTDAYITLYDMNGKSIDRIAVKATAGKSSVQVGLEKLTAGSYSYVLFVNGVKQDAKIMQVVR
jgi:hypothetical protein